MKHQTWVGTHPTHCQICEEEITDQFIDGRTRSITSDKTAGPWAVMCVRCHGNYGVGLGTGHGQKYQRGTDGVFNKVEG